MAEKYRFFPSVSDDRLYTASDVNEYLYDMLEQQEGVLHGITNELAVTNAGTLSVDIDTGAATKQGALYVNDASLNKALSSVSSGNKRYDRIVIRISSVTRNFIATIVQGTEAASPTIPSIVSSTDVLLATVLIDRSSGSYVYTVTDEREYRPYVNIDAAAIAYEIHGASAKTALVDADEMTIADSADAYNLKKITWANVKNTIITAWGVLVNALTGKTTPVDADSFAIQDSAASNATKQVTFLNLASYIWSKLGALINGGTAKATPVDADKLGYSDSAASWATKSFTFANLWTWIKSKATATPTASAVPISDASGKLDGWVSDSAEGTKGKVALASTAPAALGVAAKGSGTTAAKSDHVHAMPTLDNVGEGTNYKRVTAAEKTATTTAVATSASAPWVAPTIYFPDQERAKLERASGGRATIFYSADGLKTPCEVVLLPAFGLADVSPYFSRARANSTAYSIGELLTANGQLYEVTTAGTTGASAPVYPTNVGDTVSDGTAVLTLQVNSYNDLDPAFIVAGVKKAGLWVGRFQATVSNGKPLVIPGQLPLSVTIDNMRAYCAAFGGGCRPMTGLDWAAIQKDALRKGVVPVGNTNYGRSHKSPELQWGGVRGDGARPGDTSISTNPYTRGGSAGKKWTHNQEEWGIHDFVGNVWQWTDGYKLMDGQLYIAAYDNDPALLTTVGEDSWIATGIFFDSPAAGNDAGADNLGTPRLDAAVVNYTSSVVPTRDFATIKADSRDLDYAAATWTSYGIQAGYDAISFLSRRIAFLTGLAPKMRVGGPFPFSASEGYSYMRNNGERFAHRGGSYATTSNAGPSLCNFSSRRSIAYAFRPVFPV